MTLKDFKKMEMLAEVTYSRYGQTYKETFTPKQAREELFENGYLEAYKLTDMEALSLIQELFGN